jgi:hypothetical protein
LRTTLPYVLYAYGAVSVLDIKKRADEWRRFAVESPSRRALFAAVAVLTSDDPSATFSTAEVRAALVSLGHCWSRGTVRDLFEDETSAVKGRLLRVRRGVFRVRGEDQRALSVTGRAMAPVRDHVHAAMRQLAAEGRKRVTRAEVQERLAASGARYSQGAVLQGLLQLRQAIPAVVVLGPDQRYWLVAQ